MRTPTKLRHIAGILGSIVPAPPLEFVIEFRSGSFFQSFEDEHGGPKNTAQRFASALDAEAFMQKHDWILFAGGMVVSA